MCPVCLTTAALLASSTTSSGGFATLLTKKTYRRAPLSAQPGKPAHTDCNQLKKPKFGFPSRHKDLLADRKGERTWQQAECNHPKWSQESNG
jgi:hypothetical protein